MSSLKTTDEWYRPKDQRGTAGPASQGIHSSRALQATAGSYPLQGTPMRTTGRTVTQQNPSNTGLTGHKESNNSGAPLLRAVCVIHLLPLAWLGSTAMVQDVSSGSTGWWMLVLVARQRSFQVSCSYGAENHIRRKKNC